ncbi:hypothetical protein [Streptomyces sp. NBC_00687]|uniref:hypothetical protein n=1 Tax=Streptomyces sp. NBC_00687 TaxID=2975807 RepID=UPI002254C377|nr:hypothetical protein [Streptomyces sp. NBC_00687]MCX4918972.1 hypothetical protein [Streptomyces sp. NBC_00687]
MPSDLLTHVRHALIQAGFHLVAKGAAAEVIGLSVVEVPDGVLVSWTASDGFTALANYQLGDGGDSIRETVRAAVPGLLRQRGYRITSPRHDDDLLLLTNG